MGGFAHDTSEDGLTRLHLADGGELIRDIGSGCFGCRAPDGFPIRGEADEFGYLARWNRARANAFAPIG